MRTVLGLDAGGTFTDSVIIDAETSEVLYKAKTSTTPNDLTVCLETAFRALPQALVRDVSMVCLSTTLATNAVVEGRGCREGLILIGSKPRGKLPTPRHVLVQGRYDMKGRVVENLDPAQVDAAVDSLRGSVDAIAISGYASVRNPDHELYVKAVVDDRLGVPVVCAHELSSQLGHYERTVTAVLNASLIPLVWELTDSVKDVMLRFGVQAPLMMVRGDGTLMPEGVARSKPIETILSGPAASAIGAVHLSGRPDCLVVDVGGTTTDVAHVRDGRLVTRADGARVGDWRTQVRAAEVFTVGLGGDSRVLVDGTRTLHIGPSRSISYSVAALQHPHLERELEGILGEPATSASPQPEHEAYVLGRRTGAAEPSPDEQVVLDALDDGAHTLAALRETTHLPALTGVLSGLVRDGAVRRISLTPTDMWHVTGEYRVGSVRAAELALQITAGRLSLSTDAFVALLRRRLRERMDLTVGLSAVDSEREHDVTADRGAAESFLKRHLLDGGSPLLRASFAVRLPVVAIGGPASTWWTAADASQLFDPEVPEHADVANAVGAAVAHAVERVEVLIRKDTLSGRYLVFSPQGKEATPTLDAATDAAVRSGRAFLARLLRQEPADVEVHVSDVELSSVGRDGEAFVERVVSLGARPEI